VLAKDTRFIVGLGLDDTAALEKTPCAPGGAQAALRASFLIDADPTHLLSLLAILTTK
jgi:hypothetical protein